MTEEKQLSLKKNKHKPGTKLELVIHSSEVLKRVPHVQTHLDMVLAQTPVQVLPIGKP